MWKLIFAFLKDFIYLFLERGEGREKEREENINVWLPLAHPTGDLTCNPGMCSRLGIELVTFWFAGQHSIHWTTSTRAIFAFIENVFWKWELWHWSSTICENGLFLFFVKSVQKPWKKWCLSGKVNGLNWNNLETNQLKCQITEFGFQVQFCLGGENFVGLVPTEIKGEGLSRVESQSLEVSGKNFPVDHFRILS